MLPGYVAGGIGPAGAAGPPGPPEMLAEGTAETVDGAAATVTSYTLTNNRRYVLRFKTTAWDASGNGGYWEHVMVVARIGGPASVTQDVEALAVAVEYSGATLIPTTDGANAVRMDVVGEVGKTIEWQTRIFAEYDRAV